MQWQPECISTVAKNLKLEGKHQQGLLELRAYYIILGHASRWLKSCYSYQFTILRADASCCNCNKKLLKAIIIDTHIKFCGYISSTRSNIITILSQQTRRLNQMELPPTTSIASNQTRKQLQFPTLSINTKALGSNNYPACAHAQQGTKQSVCLSSVVCQHKNRQISTFRRKQNQ